MEGAFVALFDSTAAKTSIANSTLNRLRSFTVLAEPDATISCQPLPIRRIAWQAAGVWLATRLVFLLLTALASAFGFIRARPSAASLFPANPSFARYVLPLLSGHPLLANWVHWDASWYLLISQRGYDIFTADSSGFFPLYPLQIHLLTVVIGARAALPAALALSNLAALAAFIGLGLLAAHEAGSQEQVTEASARLIGVTAAYPFAFFLFAPFTEGCFLACVVFGLLCARRGWWRWALLCGVLAGLTRPTAFALIPALAWEYGRQRGLWQSAFWRAGVWRSLRGIRILTAGAVVAAGPALGLSVYLLFLQLRYGHAFTAFTAQTTYHGHRSWPIWQTLAELARRFFLPHSLTPSTVVLYLDGGLLLLFLAITLLNAHRLPLFYTLYTLATLFFLLSTPVPHRPELLPSAGRYLLMATPIFLLLADWVRKRPALAVVVFGGGFMLQALFTLLFLTGLWIE
ncbi:MAG TPA: hypothetical protein VF792_09700 [Ktedonobacterales bacterium]